MPIREGASPESRELFFFSSRRRHTRSLCDWSSDVCSSDLEVGDDATVLEQPCLVLIGGRQANRRCAHESMSARRLACGHSENGARDHAPAVHHYQAVHGAHELRFAFAPAHHLRNRELLRGIVDDIGEYRVEDRALQSGACDENCSSRSITAFERGDFDAMLSCESDYSLRWRFYGGPQYLACSVGRLPENFGDQCCQSARCCKNSPPG